MHISMLKELKDFIPLEEVIDFKGFKCIGYFPYEKAQLVNDCVSVSRNIFSEVELVLSRTNYMDNKTVFIFQDTTNWETKDFAIQFKDSFCKMGRINQIIGYAGQELVFNHQ